jgi:hypothetical protein
LRRLRPWLGLRRRGNIHTRVVVIAIVIAVIVIAIVVTGGIGRRGNAWQGDGGDDDGRATGIVWLIIRGAVDAAEVVAIPGGEGREIIRAGSRAARAGLGALAGRRRLLPAI